MKILNYLKANLGKTQVYLTTILFGWVASLVLPHFQSAGSISFLLVSAFIFMHIFQALLNLPNLISVISKIHIVLLGAVFLIEILLIGLTTLGIYTPYLLLSRMGSYSMFKNEKLLIFGDLRHLTSVPNCPKDIKVGQNICDIWGRHFNQNPDVGHFFRFFKLSNTEFIGIVAIIIFFLTILFALYEIRPNLSILVFIFFTPPVMLAIDRGNEIITITLILLSVVLNARYHNSKWPVALLALAVVFKFWPFLIFIFWILLSPSFSKRVKFLYGLISVAYLAHHFDNLTIISNITQRGDSNGGSFGMVLLELNSLYGFTMLVLVLLGFIVLIRAMSGHEQEFYVLLKRDPLFFALILAFLGLFVLGSHFNYRLIILIPIALILWKSLRNLSIPYFILVVMITSRLNIVVVSTSILSLYFVYILTKYLLFHMKNRSQFD
jgi:hypothetical protein